MRIFTSSLSSVKQAFGTFGQSGRVVSLVGGGGKSTLMYFMAKTCAGQGKRVLVTTTTHIFMPAREYYAATVQEAEELWSKGNFAVIGTPEPQKGKLKAPPQPLLEELLHKADVAFIEADGSKHYPIKAPRAGEPVLLPQSDLVIAVMGLSAVGKPLQECCFGLENAMTLLDRPKDYLLTEADAATLLASELGGRKDVNGRAFCVILNQCDDGFRRRSAELIANYLRSMGVADAVMTAFDPLELDNYNAIAKGI